MTTLAHYRSLLRTDKHRLDDELEKQAELQERIAQEVNRMEQRLDASADELKRTEARLTETVHRDALERGGKPPTVDQVAAAVRRHKDRLVAWDRWQLALADYRDWASLLEAWKIKGFTLRDLGALFGSDYFSLTQTSVGGRRGGVDDEALRSAIREATTRVDTPRRRVVIDA